MRRLVISLNKLRKRIAKILDDDNVKYKYLLENVTITGYDTSPEVTKSLILGRTRRETKKEA